MMLGIFYYSMPAYLFWDLIFIVFYLWYEKKNDNIGHTAHFMASIGGYLITLVSNPHLLIDHTPGGFISDTNCYTFVMKFRVKPGNMNY
jgi:hypothetical protein